MFIFFKITKAKVCETRVLTRSVFYSAGVALGAGTASAGVSAVSVGTGAETGAGAGSPADSASMGSSSAAAELRLRQVLSGQNIFTFGLLGLSHRHGGRFLFLLSDVGWYLGWSWLWSSYLLSRSCGWRIRALLHAGRHLWLVRRGLLQFLQFPLQV